MSSLDLVISARERDLGGFSVRRVLPFAGHRMVGPFIFFDHMGPAKFGPGQGMDVRPHPHIGLATVTYLYAGAISHRDSLGSVQDIEPGAINWMTAGRGIVHSERTPRSLRSRSSELHGIQCWVALPQEFEQTEPAFHHYPSATLPEFQREGASVKLLVGKLFQHESPVQVHSDLFYAEAFLTGPLTLATDGRESAVYVVSGKLRVDGREILPGEMAVANQTADMTLDASERTHVMLLGGSPVGERKIWWNLVSSSESRLQEARDAWKDGPTAGNPYFRPIPGDDSEFIPAPTS